MGNQSAKSRAILNIMLTIIRVLANCIFYAVVVILLIKAAQYAYSFAYDVFGTETVAEAPGREVEVRILKGESTMSVAEKLERNKLINNKYAFYLKAKLLGTNIMPGTFVLSDSMTYQEILDKISDQTASIEPVEEETTKKPAAEKTESSAEDSTKEPTKETTAKK